MNWKKLGRGWILGILVRVSALSSSRGAVAIGSPSGRDGRYDSGTMLSILREARRLLAVPGNDFAFSSWQSADDGLAAIDGLITSIEKGEMPPVRELSTLFAPSGPLQEVSISSGWPSEFLDLARRFDVATGKIEV